MKHKYLFFNTLLSIMLLGFMPTQGYALLNINLDLNKKIYEGSFTREYGVGIVDGNTGGGGTFQIQPVENSSISVTGDGTVRVKIPPQSADTRDDFSLDRFQLYFCFIALPTKDLVGGFATSLGGGSLDSRGNLLFNARLTPGNYPGFFIALYVENPTNDQDCFQLMKDNFNSAAKKSVYISGTIVPTRN